jgi:hypothetical protein
VSERTYTLKAARHKLAKQECLRYNHNWDIIEAFGPGPTTLICERCGRQHPIGEAVIEVRPELRCSASRAFYEIEALRGGVMTGVERSARQNYRRRADSPQHCTGLRPGSGGGG